MRYSWLEGTVATLAGEHNIVKCLIAYTLKLIKGMVYIAHVHFHYPSGILLTFGLGPQYVPLPPTNGAVTHSSVLVISTNRECPMRHERISSRQTTCTFSQLVMRLINWECECRLLMGTDCSCSRLSQVYNAPLQANWSVTWQWLLALASLSVLAWLDEQPSHSLLPLVQPELMASC